MELIDREKLQSTIRNMVELPNEVRAQVLGAVSRVKAVDVKPVVHGRWIPCENGGYYCSNCDRRVAFLVHNKYCPNCGAKMDRLHKTTICKGGLNMSKNPVTQSLVRVRAVLDDSLVGTLIINGREYSIYLGSIETYPIGCGRDAFAQATGPLCVKHKFTLIER